MRERPTPGSLYMTYDCYHRMLHVSRAGEGTNGFLRYLHDDMMHVLQNGHNPDIWACYFEFPDRRDIPDVSRARYDDYFSTVLEKTRRNEAHPRYTVSLRDAVYCTEHGIVSLTPQAQRSQLLQLPDYVSYGLGTPHTDIFIPEYKAYDGLQTEEGLMLFSQTAEGRRQRGEYEKLLERNFFNPVRKGGELKYWEIIAEPQQVKGQVDRLSFEASDASQPQELEYAAEDILTQGSLLRSYDLFRRQTSQDPAARSLLDLSLKDLLACFTAQHREPHKECVDTMLYPGEKTETTYKIRT